MPARSPMAIEGELKSLASRTAAGVAPKQKLHRPWLFTNARQSSKPESYTSPGFVARFGATWPAPCRKIRLAAVVVSSTSYPVVMSDDLMAIGDHVGWACLRSAPRPATWGDDIDVPLRRLKLRPWPAGVGATAARMSWPGAMTSGFSRSPPPAASGPRDEKL